MGFWYEEVRCLVSLIGSLELGQNGGEEIVLGLCWLIGDGDMVELVEVGDGWKGAEAMGFVRRWCGWVGYHDEGCTVLCW
jgi:hypothetical protein